MKACFKCGSFLPLAEFYGHPYMADKHLNKCKSCTRDDARARRAEKIKDPAWVEAELLRSRLKARRLRATGVKVSSNRYSRLGYIVRYPHKIAANRKVAWAIKTGVLKPSPCAVCGVTTGVHAHHENYDKPLDVVWLCPRHHADRHIEIRRLHRAAKALKAA